MNNLLRLRDGVARREPDDRWTLIKDTSGDVPSGPLILPLALWLKRRFEHHPVFDAVWLGPDDEVESLAPWLNRLPMIALEFPNFRDGRAYSQAYLLRTRLGWAGELRAIGDVLRDQLFYLHRCGFDAFALRADKDPYEALESLKDFSVTYQAATDEPLPLFRRRQ